MAGHKLKVHVSVHDGFGGTHTCGPDDDLPEWAEIKLADNPLVWADGDEPTDEDKQAAVDLTLGGISSAGQQVDHRCTRADLPDCIGRGVCRQRSRGGLSPSRITQPLLCLKHVLALAVMDGRLARNVAEHVKSSKAAEYRAEVSHSWTGA